ncbi:MAG TPA: hypothetical protein VGK96_26130 [Candidatus Sulfotelmatobacter sp.]
MNRYPGTPPPFTSYNPSYTGEAADHPINGVTGGKKAPACPD